MDLVLQRLKKIFDRSSRWYVNGRKLEGPRERPKVIRFFQNVLLLSSLSTTGERYAALRYFDLSTAANSVILTISNPSSCVESAWK
ncbi:hypothetical protein M0802_008619 [Mischocyttarus mexicanus]|nr:hypothetical protein M0802_008619 [Mischocyttarus mexicanus]